MLFYWAWFGWRWWLPHFGPRPGEAAGTLPTQLIPCVGPLWNMKVLCKTLRAWHPRESGTMSEEQWDYFRGNVGTVPRLAWQRMLGEGWCDCTDWEQSRNPPSIALESDLVKVKVAQLCPTFCDPMHYTVHGILQARILEWVAFPFSRGSSQPRDWTQVSCIAGRFFTTRATREAQEYWSR